MDKRSIKDVYYSHFSNRKKVQNYRFCIFEGVSKHDLLHSTGHKSLKIGSKSNKWGSLNKFRKFAARWAQEFPKLMEKCLR